jgi:hypothetical protein
VEDLIDAAQVFFDLVHLTGLIGGGKEGACVAADDREFSHRLRFARRSAP